MRRAAMLLLATVVVSIFTPPSWTAAEETNYLRSYPAQTEFLFGTPGTAAEAMSGFVNPAAWRMMPGGEVQFLWTEPVKEFNALRSWALAFGGGGLNFGVTHWNWKPETQVYANNPTYAGFSPEEKNMTDYVLGLSMGDKRSAVGIGYHWSTGELPFRTKDRALSIGSIWRPVAHFSLGTFYAYAFDDKDYRWGGDVGIRPFGSSILTLFGDAVTWKDEAIKDALWSAGVAAEFLPGVALVGRIREDESYSAGISISLGTMGVSAHPLFDKDDHHFQTTYAARAGYRKPVMGGKTMGGGNDYFSLDMKGRTRYRRYRLFDDGGHTLTELLSKLEEVRTNDHYGGIAMNLSGMSISPAVRWEVREKLQQVRSAGKKVVIFVDIATMGSYHLASVADLVVMDPEGGLLLHGLGMARTYMKNMMDKLGLGVDEWRFFKYKSAAESYSREEMSEADREQRQEILDDFYAEMRKDVSRSRGFAEARFDSIVNHMVFASADTVLNLGLVDTLARWSAAKDVIKEFEGEAKRVSGCTGMAYLKTYDDTWGRPPKVAVIYGLGVCAMDEGIAGRRLGGVIKSARENPNIKAVVFRADSPGGEIIPSDIVAEELEKTSKEKPVIVSQGYVAGSGGYWISMNGDKILATPLTITGSIGVIGVWVWNQGLGEKLGLTSTIVKTGDHADLALGIRLPLLGIMISDRNLTPWERKKAEREILAFYETFLGKVAAGRNMTRDQVHRIAEGRVWSGRDGVDVGIVDEIGGLEQAIAMAKEAAGIPEDQKVEIVELPKMGWFNPQMFQIGSPIRVDEESLDVQYTRMVLQAQGRPLAIIPPELLMIP